jgi:hypothetical protein
VFTYLAHSSDSSYIINPVITDTRHHYTKPDLIQKVAKLKRTLVKLKIGALPPDRTSGPDGVRLLSDLSTLPKIQTVHAS